MPRKNRRGSPEDQDEKFEALVEKLAEDGQLDRKDAEEALVALTEKNKSDRQTRERSGGQP